MPRIFLADVKRRLGEAFALLDARIDDLMVSDGISPLHDRLVVAPECVRDAIAKVEHAEEAIRGETAEACVEEGKPTHPPPRLHDRPRQPPPDP